MEPISSLRRSYVYIDVPNVSRRDDQRKRIPLNLEALLADICEYGADGTSIENLHIYTQDSDKMKGSYDSQARALAEDGIESSLTISPRRKDVDQLIVDDLWRQSTRHIQGGRNPERRVRHIIASGDGGFIRTVESMRESLEGMGLQMQVLIYSWRASCSNGWRNPAYQIRYLDSIPGILLPERSIPAEPPT